jgi:hypothetical protein
LFNNLSTNKFSYTLSSPTLKTPASELNTSAHFLKLTSLLKSNLVSNYTFDNFSSPLNTLNIFNSHTTASKDLIVLRSESDLINLEDDSIIMDLFTNSLSDNSVNVFSTTTTTSALNISTSLKPLTVSTSSSQQTLSLSTTLLDKTFTRDLLSLLKIY